ncbi:MAG: hypothetical protein RL662_1951 [Bacteroidota bacterium]|jgi:TonB-linked SusC/RagA family outer membrane protein
MNNVERLKVPRMANLTLWSKISAAFVMLLFSISMYAQTGAKITVSGIVTDAAGETLIGASVAEKGTTNATMTGIDGDYILTVPANAILEVTYVGFNQKQVPVKGQTKLNIVVSEDTKLLEEVVVTALGIKRDKKSLGYALQEIKGDQLTESRDPNVANALAGKVAGLQIKQSGTGPSGSSRIVLRGANSIGGNNQPLVVVDGVPIDSSTGGTDDYWGNQSVDKGSGMADISPDDIESMSVLKGPAAAALYGSRAGNGVIMITTKKGSTNKGLGITVNSNLMVESPMQMPKYQDVYGQGTGGKYAINETMSWGGKMDGAQVTDIAGNKVIYSAGDNKLQDFLKTGTTWTNSIDLSSVTDKNTVRVGIMNLRNTGIVPNSSFGRTSATLRGTAKLSEKLSLDAKITYVNQKTENRVKLAGDGDNIFYNYLTMPRSIHFSDLKNMYPGYAFPEGTVYGDTNLSSKPYSWTSKYDGVIRNPYWAVNKNTNDDRKNRMLGFGLLKYDFTDWLSIQGRYGIDYYSYQSKNRHATGTPYWYQEGDYLMYKEDFYEVNSDFLITFNKNLTDKVNLVATGGGNIMYTRTEGLRSQNHGLIIPNFYTIANAKGVRSSSALYRRQINSLYSTASLSYGNMLYLDLTARNDWSSTLNKENRSYFYPSVNASWLLSESLKRMSENLGFIDYAKIRASWAQVGNDAKPYQLLDYESLSTEYVVNPNNGEIETLLNGSKSSTLALYDLKNELISSYELGLEFKALKNRVGLDFAFYSKDAKNQILRMNIPPASGYQYKYINAGNVRNRGIEFVLSGTPVQSKDFQWDVVLNYSKNKNKIIELSDGIEQQILSDASYDNMIRIVAKVGGAYGDLYGTTVQKDAAGNVVVDKEGLPMKNGDYVKLGNSSPEWMGGLTNSFKYKNFDLSFQIDMRYGGDVYMGSIKAGMGAGTLEGTLHGREGMLVAGVTESGAANTVQTTAQSYWARMGGISEAWIYDATNIKFRELSLGYAIPRKVLAKSPFSGVKLSLVARNLFMIHSNTKGFDPEAGFSTGNAQGFEFASMPTLRSYGFNLNVSF